MQIHVTEEWVVKQRVTLPLFFGDHSAHIVAKSTDDGGWDVRTEIDGREVGTDHFRRWHLVEQFRARMQQWLSEAHNLERGESAA